MELFGKILYTISLFYLCISMIQASRPIINVGSPKEPAAIEEDKVDRHRRQALPVAEFSQNCPFGTVLEEIIDASPYEACFSSMFDLFQIDPSDYISSSGQVFGYLSVICEEQCRNYVYSTLQRCLPALTPQLQLACAANSDQTQCWQAVANNSGTEVLVTCYPELYPLPQESGSGSGANAVTFPPTLDESGNRICSPYCQGALMSLRNLHGCCISNAFNTSTFGLLGLGVANYTLWAACDIETTSFCSDLTFVNIFAPETTTPDSGAQKVAVSFFVLFVMVGIGYLHV